MRYVIDIPPELAEEINRRIRSGKYKSPQDFVLAAIQNQAYLETVETDSGSTVSVTEGLSAPSAKLPSFRKVFGGASLLLPAETTRVKTVPVSSIDRSNYLWGQYNRLFPIKIIVRVATNLASEYSSEYFPLAELQEKSSDIARELGKVIRQKDNLMGRKRGTILSAGLPVGRKLDKAILRFKNQFVGYLAKDRLEGAAPTLKFIEMVRNNNNITLVGTTDFGLKFSSLPNPIIDREDYSAPFSDEEVEFLLSHITTELAGEAKLIRLVLSSVKSGSVTPDELNDKIRSYNRKWTENEIVAMRVGVVSRINELGLLGRHKNGVKVTYELTGRGEDYLSRLAAAGA